ncbi:SpoIIE family protein phosphatase [Pontibacter qinzhouensis]|uniref:SpoIIE family protein phosphatase n=1 Tax=Pontibacter qinzhouensis TaxID=2603253 RepID=A0A5C8K9Y4_9BACT|nr:ATP-binding protein [Pontibacter qinzhouensis]TXK48718.1 SpoIIE family protein phosphatase [Pontibacter qinzhouensis]
MDVKHHQSFLLPDRTYANIVKRDITRIAESYGFSPAEVGRVNIVVSEMVSNLQKHTTQGGEILIKQLDKTGIEIICLDNGPGMADAIRTMEDGYSSVGTAGEGLGAIKRQSHEFDIFSQLGAGTILLSRMFKGHYKPSPMPKSRYEVAAVMVPKPGEFACGDNYAMLERGNDCYLIALDGLGHGPNAQEASTEAANAFLSQPSQDPAAVLRHIHGSIRRTRGSVGTVAHISLGKKQISFCGVGNIAGKIFSVEGPYLTNALSRNIMAYNGILGHNVPSSFSTQIDTWNNSKLLVLHSDGLKSRWDISKYTNLHRRDASIIAALLYRDFCRQTDDTLVLVARSKA